MSILLFEPPFEVDPEAAGEISHIYTIVISLQISEQIKLSRF
jgi:hypothetical protein